MNRFGHVPFRPGVPGSAAAALLVALSVPGAASRLGTCGLRRCARASQPVPDEYAPPKNGGLLSSRRHASAMCVHGSLPVQACTSVESAALCVESGISGSTREYQESRSGMGVSGVPDIRESGPTGYPGYLRDIRNQDQGWGYQVLSLISLIQHRQPWLGTLNLNLNAARTH
jgi:hypothetical protein